MAEPTPFSILIIEDDADTRANISDILELGGYRAFTASTFAQALNRENWDEIGAILTDRKLPDGLAEDMLPRIRRAAPDVPIVVVTGFPDVQGAITALREGAYDYILKPINPDALLASLGRIAERKRIERALRDREERLNAILETAPDAILMIDKYGVVQSANPATERMFGFTPAELVGQNIGILMPESRSKDISYLFSEYRVGKDAQAVVNRVVTARRKDGTTFPIDLAISEIAYPRSYTAIIRDVSERQELQRQVLEIAAEEDRRIGHELHDNIQQQLTGLSLLARTLADKLAVKFPSEAPRAKRLADEINETAKQVHMLSRGLVPVEVDTQGLRAALAELTYKIGDVHRIGCQFRCEDVISVADNFVATHLYRIAQEAINNAVKHSQAKRILVSLMNSDGNIVLEVADDGVGIDEKSEFNPGMGLRIMSYRAGLIGASLDVNRRNPGGTAVSCTVWQSAPRAM